MKKVLRKEAFAVSCWQWLNISDNALSNKANNVSAGWKVSLAII